jgi:hypothetical protein
MSKQAVLALSLLASGLGACASSKSSEPPRQGVERLLQLYNDDRARFVRNLQQMEQDKKDCDHVADLKKEAEKMDFDGSVPKEQQQSLVVVKMELAEAEKICRK